MVVFGEKARVISDDAGDKFRSRAPRDRRSEVKKEESRRFNQGGGHDDTANSPKTHIDGKSAQSKELEKLGMPQWERGEREPGIPQRNNQTGGQSPSATHKFQLKSNPSLQNAEERNVRNIMREGAEKRNGRSSKKDR